MAGSYTIHNGTGGPDVKSFNLAVSLPSLMSWTNSSSIQDTISRAQPLKVTWASGNPNGVIVVTGGAASEAAQENDRVSAGFTCTERLSAGEFTIPAAILQMFPKTAAPGYLTVRRRLTAIKFTADGLDGLFFTYRDGFRRATVRRQRTSSTACPYFKNPRYRPIQYGSR